MIKDVEVLDIRRKHKNGMTIADLARQTGYCEKTISKWLKTDAAPRYRRRSRRVSKLKAYHEYIMERMDEGVFNCEVLLKELREEGYDGGKTLLKDFVAPFRKQFQTQAVSRFETKPAEQAQVDWAYLGTFWLDGRARKVWVFLMLLGYSRYLAAHVSTSMDVSSLLRSHQYCFARLGGVTRQIVYDNMKTVTLGRDVAHQPVWQQQFLDFALYHDFQPVLCTPYKPWSKGKVEISVDYIKNNFCPGRTFEDLGDLNRQLQDWLDRVANVRTHGTTGEMPAKRWAQEPLTPLPIRPYPVQVRFSRQVSRDSYLSYLGVLYSVPWAYAGGKVEVEETMEGVIRVHGKGGIIAEHRMPPPGQHRVSDARHTEGLAAAQRMKKASGLRQVYPEVQARSLSVYEDLVGTS